MGETLSAENPISQPEPCLIKQLLIADLKAIHDAIADLNEQDVQCIMNADLAGTDAITLQLAKARIRRELAIAALRQHMDEHECQQR